MNLLKTSWNLEIKHPEYYYSEPAQEILGSIPSWITRWGVTIIFGVFAMIIVGSCLIDYPQTLTAPITVTVSEDGTITGEALVPSPGFGKVQVGQRVNVRLDCYPYLQYGTLMGEVEYISSKPIESPLGTYSYCIKVCFNKDEQIIYDFIQLGHLEEQPGIAQIIVQRQKLIEHYIPLHRLHGKGEAENPE